jgi:hypothetical protein
VREDDKQTKGHFGETDPDNINKPGFVPREFENYTFVERNGVAVAGRSRLNFRETPSMNIKVEDDRPSDRISILHRAKVQLLTYSATDAKWYSAPVEILSFITSFTWTTVNATPQDTLWGATIGYDCNAIADAGLVPQFMGGYTLNYTQPSTDSATAEFKIIEGVHDETGAPPGTVISSSFMNGTIVGNTTWQRKHFDWVTVTPSSTTDAGWWLGLFTKNSAAGTGQIWMLGVYMRWIST